MHSKTHYYKSTDVDNKIEMISRAIQQETGITVPSSSLDYTRMASRAAVKLIMRFGVPHLYSVNMNQDSANVTLRVPGSGSYIAVYSHPDMSDTLKAIRKGGYEGGEITAQYYKICAEEMEKWFNRMVDELEQMV